MSYNVPGRLNVIKQVVFMKNLNEFNQELTRDLWPKQPEELLTVYKQLTIPPMYEIITTQKESATNLVELSRQNFTGKEIWATFITDLLYFCLLLVILALWFVVRDCRLCKSLFIYIKKDMKHFPSNKSQSCFNP